MSQYGDGDTVEAHNEEQRVARNPHQCSACKETIQPGHKYTRVFFIWEKAPYVYMRCERCQIIFEHLEKRIGDEGECEEFCDAELNCGHTYEERWDEPPPEWLAALAFWRPGDPLPEEVLASRAKAP